MYNKINPFQHIINWIYRKGNGKINTRKHAIWQCVIKWSQHCVSASCTLYCKHSLMSTLFAFWLLKSDIVRHFNNCKVLCGNVSIFSYSHALTGWAKCFIFNNQIEPKEISKKSIWNWIGAINTCIFYDSMSRLWWWNVDGWNDLMVCFFAEA